MSIEFTLRIVVVALETFNTSLVVIGFLRNETLPIYSVVNNRAAIVRQFAGEFTARVPPVPIPNTEVKPRWADGTARVSVWEIR